MKNLILVMFVIFAYTNVNAQDDDFGNQTSEGKWLIEANTGNALLGTTGIYFSTSDGSSSYNIGLDGGYFIMDDLAIKQAELDSVAAKYNLTLNADDYDDAILKQF